MNELVPVQTLRLCQVQLVLCLLGLCAYWVEEVGTRSISATEYE